MFNSKSLSASRKTKLNSFDDSVTIITNNSEISRIADIQYGSSRSYKNNRLFAKELSKWLRLSKRHNTGMNHRSNAVGSWSKMLVGKTVLKVTPKILDKMAIKYLHLVNCSSAVGWISQSSFDKQHLINSGKLLEKISLWATSNGLSLTPLAAIVESEEGKLHLSKLQKKPSLTPIIFFRISDILHPIHHTPRKSFKPKAGA